MRLQPQIRGVASAANPAGGVSRKSGGGFSRTSGGGRNGVTGVGAHVRGTRRRWHNRGWRGSTGSARGRRLQIRDAADADGCRRCGGCGLGGRSGPQAPAADPATARQPHASQDRPADDHADVASLGCRTAARDRRPAHARFRREERAHRARRARQGKAPHGRNPCAGGGSDPDRTGGGSCPAGQHRADDGPRDRSAAAAGTGQHGQPRQTAP